MKIRVTIDCFSGRENPSFELTGREASELLGRLKLGAGLDAAAQPSTHRLGYRGLKLELSNGHRSDLPRKVFLSGDRIFAKGLAAELDQPGLEAEWLTETNLLARTGLDPAAISTLAADIASALGSGVDSLLKPPIPPIPPIPPPPKVIVVHHENQAPIYEPTWWNDGAGRQRGNNCYNYGCDSRTDTFAQPGRASGHLYPEITGAAVRAAAVSDDLIDTPNADNKFPQFGHLVALVVAPGFDYHWFRKDGSGKWSHKPGSTQAVCVDNAGAAISDPRLASRGMYKEFTTFMNVRHGHIRIR